ncbi:polyprenyl synthetase family protein [Allofustis seminis]|uniref:polyprenyl synthetase family protein n=1 Tax=Allofustis seminis TaxID=166939 RepID=UPI0003746865|nr:farnesyl diphosphate synthase [Allofustis seminis]
MESATFQKKYDQLKTMFENHMTTLDFGEDTKLTESMSYSLYAKGKRLRPLLLLMTLESYDIRPEEGLNAATAVEMVHTYSLIHDDLPAMDDDSLRRGMPTNHMKYGEATAILAGDALLTQAFFELTKGTLAPSIKIRLVQLLADCSGALGMCAGQQYDILVENQKITLEALVQIHQLKTGKLFEYCTVAAGIIATATTLEVKWLRQYAKSLGLAFQIRDDLLDIIGDPEILGKNIGADEYHHKSTYPALLGIDKTYFYLNHHLQEAINALNELEMLNPNFNKRLLMDFVKKLELEYIKNDK